MAFRKRFSLHCLKNEQWRSSKSEHSPGIHRVAASRWIHSSTSSSSATKNATMGIMAAQAPTDCEENSDGSSETIF